MDKQEWNEKIRAEAEKNPPVVTDKSAKEVLTGELPTAKEARDSFINGAIERLLSTEYEEKDYLEECFIEFAKLHVEAALKAASKEVKMKGEALTTSEPIDEEELIDLLYSQDIGISVNKDSILNAYPSSNVR